MTPILLMMALSGTADPAGAVSLGRAAVAAGDLAAGVVHFKAAIEAYPTWGLAHLELAEALLKEEADSDLLRNSVEAALRLEPQNPRVWCVAGQWRDGRGEPEAAVEAFAKALELRPDLVTCRERLGLVLARMGGRDREATRHLESACATYRDDAQACLTLTELYERTGHVARAEAQLKVLSDRAPPRSVYRRRLAELYERTGQTRLADREYRRMGAPTPARRMRPLPPSRR